MRHTIKAVFDDRDKAQLALAQLLACGFERTDTVLATIPGTRSASADDTPVPAWRERPGTSSARLLARLIGHPGSRPAVVASPSDAQDSHVLTLSTDSAQEAERAAGLMSGFVQACGEDARTSASGRQANNAHDAGHNFGSRDADDTAMPDATSREPTPMEGHWHDRRSEARRMREDHTGQPGSDDAGRVAYRFGHDMHENERYRNRSWHEADSDLKVLWEARGPHQAGWSRSEAAIRLGWDSISPEIDDDSYYRSHWRTRRVDSAKGAGSTRRPTSAATARAAGSTPGERHPRKPTAWENFVDAVKHGWSRTLTGNDMDETDYRLHHARTYPGTSYDDLAPVYRYGHHVRRRTMFAGRDWDEVERELRAEWERGLGEGKPSTWDQMKAALHQGWDRTEN